VGKGSEAKGREGKATQRRESEGAGEWEMANPNFEPEMRCGGGGDLKESPRPLRPG
jgi:hypothetical protein